MAKIHKTYIYNFKNTPVLSDYLVGTDKINNKKTKSFQLADIISLTQNSLGLSSISFKYVEDINEDLELGCFNSNLSDLSTVGVITISKTSYAGINLSELLSVIDESTENIILKIDNNDFENLGYFKIIDVLDNNNDTYSLELEPVGKLYNGVLDNNNIYSFIFYPIDIPKENNKITIEGEIFTWYPLASNTSGIPEQGDPATGRIANFLYQLSYNTGDPTLLNSWNILNREQLY